MNILSILASVFGFIALAGGAAGYFKASRGDSIIKYQEKEIELRNEKIAQYEKDIVTYKSESATKDGTIEELKKHNEYLQKMGQGSPQLAKLTKAIENQTILINEFIKKEKRSGAA